MGSPLLIFSDSNALIGDIQWVFRDRMKCLSSCSIEWIERYLKYHDIDLLIADLDMDLDRNFQAEVLEGFRDYRHGRIAFLYLVSEKKKLELEKDFDSLYGMVVSADWLIKPFSRDALITSVDRLCS